MRSIALQGMADTACLSAQPRGAQLGLEKAWLTSLCYPPTPAATLTPQATRRECVHLKPSQLMLVPCLHWLNLLTVNLLLTKVMLL